MTVLKDNSSQLNQVEHPWQKWTPEEKEKAFQEFREREPESFLIRNR
jgi:hypothetical protein